MFTGRFGRVIIVAKDNNTNMLRTEVWKELRQLDELVQNMTVTLPSGEIFSYKEECARWEGQCYTNDILNLDKIIGEVSLNFHCNKYSFWDSWHPYVQYIQRFMVIYSYKSSRSMYIYIYIYRIVYTVYCSCSILVCVLLSIVTLH